MVIIHVVDSILSGGVATMVRNLVFEQAERGQKVAVVTDSKDICVFWNSCTNVLFFQLKFIP